MSVGKLWFIGLSSTGMLVYSGNKLGFVFPKWIQFYLNDLLIVSITAMLVRWLMQRIFRMPHLSLRIWHTSYIVFFYTVLFEGILPHFMERYNGDLTDVLMYAIGGLFYHLVLNRQIPFNYPYRTHWPAPLPLT